MHYRTQLLLMLAPFLLGLTILVVLPAAGSLAVAFFDYSPVQPTRFIASGLDQFRKLGEDQLFWTALGNSLLYTAGSVPLRLVGALALALLLDRRRRGIGLYRAAAYLPTIIPDVPYTLAWLWIFNPRFGPISQVLRSLHLPIQTWLVDTGGSRAIVILMAAWQVGEGLVVLLAALRDIPPELYDAARADGAGAWARLRLLVLPLIAPTFMLLAFRDTIVSLQDNFAPALLITRAGGGPNNAILFLPLKIYTDAFQNFRFGYAAAMIWVLYGVTAGIVLVQYVLTRRWSGAAYD
jgi:multiple sugar transport system permease protein